jgi:HAMP domain-containing protein/HPt (histidine-containing phosphotransfer) domain-containing protein
MNIKSISFNLNASLLIITTLVLSGFGIYGYQETEKRLNKQLDLNSGLTKDRLTLSLPVPIWNFEAESVEIIIASETQSQHIQGILIIGSNDNVLAGKVKDAEGNINSQNEPPKQFANRYIQPLVMLENGGENDVGHAEIYTSDEYVTTFLQAELRKIVIQIIALNIVIILLFSVSIRRITKPLFTLTQAANGISQGDYEISIKIEREDEVGQLAKNFDRMRSTVKKKVSDLAELNQTGEVLASLLDSRVALEEVLKNMQEHTNVQTGSVYLYNSNDNLELKSFFPPKKIDAGAKAKSFERGEGIIGQAAHKKEIIFVENTSLSDEYVDKEDDSSNSRALLCVPLIDNNTVIGVMNFSGDVGEVIFEDSDYEYVSSIARSLVTTIKNIGMREVIEEQNRTLEQKVVERTAALQVKTNDISNMLQNMHQGLCTVRSDNTIHPEYSSYLENIYETQNVSGRNFLSLLFENAEIGSDSVDQVRAAIDVLYESDEFMWECNEHHLVKEVTGNFQGGRKKYLQLDWDPIYLDGAIEKIMITVRDVTKLKAMEKEAEKQKHVLTIIGHILNIKRSKFDDFIKTSNEFIAKNRELILNTPNKDADVIATLFRNIHTIKGNARTFGFTMITHSVHDAESTYDKLRKSEGETWNPKLLISELDIVTQKVGLYESTAKEKLGTSESVSVEDDQAIIEKSTVNKLVELVNQINTLQIPDDIKAGFDIIQKEMLQIDSETIFESISGVIQSISSLAKELDKPEPLIEIDADNILVKKEAGSTLSNVFMHILRNSMDHGIESAEERIQKGKDSQGHIYIRSKINGKQAVLHVNDDGRGLALHKFRDKAISSGTISADAGLPPEELAKLILNSGFTTAETVSEVSGRGVGMDAIRCFMEERGGKLDIELDLEKLSEDGAFCPFSLQITLPNEMYALIDTA